MLHYNLYSVERRKIEPGKGYIWGHPADRIFEWEVEECHYNLRDTTLNRAVNYYHNKRYELGFDNDDIFLNYVCKRQGSMKFMNHSFKIHHIDKKFIKKLSQPKSIYKNTFIVVLPAGKRSKNM